jgi:methyl-accepting chemotaxis protein
MNWIATSIRNKILSVFVVGIAIVAAGAIYGFAAARGGLASVERVNDTLVAQAIEAQALEATFKEQVAQWMSVLVRGHDRQAKDKSWAQFTYREREVRRNAEKLREVVELPAARELLDKFLATHTAMGTRYREALKLYESSGFDARKSDAAVKGIDTEPTELIEELVKLMRDEAKAGLGSAREKATQGLGRSLGVIAVAAVAALLAFIGCAVLLVRTVVRPLAYAVNVVEGIAAGDLTVEVQLSSRDEMGRLLQGLSKMRDSLAEAVSVIRRSAESVGTASKEIAAGQADLSSRTEQQASGLEEATSAMEELTATVKQNAESARQADVLASGASDIAGKGGNVMAEFAGTMSAITGASKKIADIIGLIDGIAFQTNILALNAAVEAARAGEQGRGFAVVAAEVRMLAHRSAAAAKEIKDLVQNSVDKVGEGTKLAEAAGNTMKEIVESAKRVTEVMSEIKVASQEQLSGIEQVSATMTHMDQAVQQNAAVMEESAAAAQHMADQAAQLMESVARFLLNDGSDAGAARSEALRTEGGDRSANAPAAGSWAMVRQAQARLVS